MNEATPQGSQDAAPHWPRVAPEAASFDPARLADAVAFARANETEWPRDMYVDGTFIASVHVGDKPPYDQPMGPVVPRGPTNGLILRGGGLVAEWGDTLRPDMTFSVAKSYLAILAGLAVDDGLLPSLDRPVRETVGDDLFADPHNRPITWRHLLQQTSEWRGTLFERPDSVDWNRQVGMDAPDPAEPEKGTERALQLPGTHFEYNDVRVNLLGLSLLRLFKEPLPSVLKRRVMDPAGCSRGWSWHGYDTSWVEIDGRRMQSVPGGGHWGGGIVIGARDHARVGEVVMANGMWQGRRLLSPEWIAAMLTPSPAHAGYGLLWWLNTGRALFPSAPESSVFALGGGTTCIWIDAPRDLVVVVRWLHKPALDDLTGRIAGAITT